MQRSEKGSGIARTEYVVFCIARGRSRLQRRTSRFSIRKGIGGGPSIAIPTHPLRTVFPYPKGGEIHDQVGHTRPQKLLQDPIEGGLEWWEGKKKSFRCCANVEGPCRNRTQSRRITQCARMGVGSGKENRGRRNGRRGEREEEKDRTHSVFV